MPTLPRLIVITDWRLPRARLLSALERALVAGPEVAVQHRHPEAPTRVFLEEARLLAALCRAHGNPLFVNGRLDVALLVGAHLHLPARGLTVENVRPALPAGRWVSAAVHDAHEAQLARGADLALVSPVYAPGSKTGDTRPPLGPDGFQALAASLSCPALALGGITPERAPQLSGAHGFAVISAVLEAENPTTATRALLRPTTHSSQPQA
ncbi:thiamine phosphate synthase [Hyalangium minutum]|uniref:Thiamin-phosphate pyrophosphorylase n=1 Tax=Hyalangium minutum TaxID=394096 RepID=A0A085WG44_9BACT|nr:thiamine phosphate synthase [Hyalangium minutum]KFE66657.1 Thiamin-phosphate pyrophosphorylase [Hyalangium minutum]